MISVLKFSSYQSKVYTLALILGLFIFVLPSCTEEVVPSQSIEIKKAGFEKFSIEDLPAMANAIAPFVNPNFEQKVDGKLTVSPQNESELSKALNYDEVIARYDGKGNTNYAMEVADNDDDPFSFSNFIIMKDSTGAFRTPFVLTYEMADDFIEEYLVDQDISKFRGKITQFDLGPMDAQRVDSRNPVTTDPDQGTGGSTGTSPTHDGNVVCEKDYAGSGGTSTGSGGYNTEVCDYYLVTVYDHSTNGTKNVWYTYISEENCRIVWIAEQAAAGTTTCPSGTGDGEIPLIEPDIIQIIIDASFVGTKAECVYNKLKQLSGGFRGSIQKFDGTFPVAHLKLSLDGSLPPTTNATTIAPSKYIIEIKINPNRLNRPNLEIARTIIHETIHAEMWRKIMSILENGDDLNGLTKTEWRNKLSNGDYPGIYYYYSKYGISNFQHEQMAEHYRNTIVNILKEFEPGLNEDVYNALTWVGLKNTVTWNALSPSEQARINGIITNFNQNGNAICN
jgi:hypothetical protein